MSTNDKKPRRGKRLLFPRAHTASFQLSISIHPGLADDVENALAYLMHVGAPGAGVPYNKSEATYRAILEHAQARGWIPDKVHVATETEGAA